MQTAAWSMKRKRSRRPLFRFLPGLATILLWIGLHITATGASGDDLERLLKRLQLTELETTLIEERLSNTIDLDQQERLRERLANLYIAQLDGLIEQPKLFTQISQRLDQLEEKVPNLKKPANYFARLDAQFRHTEYLLSQYREDRRKVSLLAKVNLSFGSLRKKFEELRSTCEKTIEKLDLIDAGFGSFENQRADDEIEQLTQISFRSTFYAAWSAFHQGMARQDRERGKPDFLVARALFCDFLDIDPESDPQGWDADFLELEAPRNAQAFLGLSLCYLALGENDDAEYCFSLLNDDFVPGTVREQLGFWQIQTCLELGEIGAARELAEKCLDPSNPLSDIQRGQIALLLIRFTYANPSAAGKNKLNDVAALGFRTLAQMRQFQLIEQLKNQYDIKLPRPSFYTDWIEGQLLYQQAEKSGSEQDFVLAATVLENAVKQSAEIPAVDVERCRYQLGWALYRGGKYAEAAECLELVIARLARLEPKLAATAIWIQHDCYLKQNPKDPVFVQKSIGVLQNLVDRFPDDQLSQRARLQIVKLKKAGLATDETIAQLKAVVESSPNDWLSRYELCLATYRKFLELVRDKKPTDEIAGEVTSLANDLAKSLDRLSPGQQLKLTLVQIDIQSRQADVDQKSINELVGRAESLSEKVSDKSLLAELHYRQFQLARKRNDEEQIQRHAQWLVDNGDGTVYQRSVLVSRIQQLEQELSENKTGIQRSRLIGEAIDVYQKLLRSTGQQVKTIQSNNNVRVAMQRLAELLEESGDPDQSEKYWQILVEAYPTKVSYLQRYARLLSRLKKAEQALDYWRRLAKGLPRESDDWYEAKYFVLQSLIELDPQKAGPPLDQFLKLYEPPDPWKSKFQQLASRLGNR